MSLLIPVCARPWWLAILVLACTSAWAGSPAPRQPVLADPLDPLASVPPRIHQSIFDRYQAWRDQPVLSWQAANDGVRQSGGWRAYAREIEASRPRPDAIVPGPPGTTVPPTHRH